MANAKTVSLRVDGGNPWIGLPAVQAEGDVTIQSMMEDANLTNWNVRLNEIVTDARPVAGKSYEVVRDNPFDGGLDRLAVVGDRYVPVQVEELADMADTITEGGATPEVFGSYRSGRSVFLVFSLGEGIVIDPEGSADKIGTYLSILSSNDGTSGIMAMTHDMRVICQNMLTSAKAAALSTFKMRHTTNVKGRILDARKALSIAFEQTDVFAQEMNNLLAHEMSDQKFWELVETVYPMPDKDAKAPMTRWEKKTDEIMGLWNGPTLANLENTAYKAYNALNEHLMWYPTIRDNNTESALSRAAGFDELTNKRNVGLYRQTLALATA